MSRTGGGFAGPAVRGDEIWCQLFSEPSPADRTWRRRAAPVRPETARAAIIDGQKVWTSGAHYADFGLLLARTARPICPSTRA